MCWLYIAADCNKMMNHHLCYASLLLSQTPLWSDSAKLNCPLLSLGSWHWNCGKVNTFHCICFLPWWFLCTNRIRFSCRTRSPSRFGSSSLPCCWLEHRSRVAERHRGPRVRPCCLHFLGARRRRRLCQNLYSNHNLQSSMCLGIHRCTSTPTLLLCRMTPADDEL